jgi:hypothetical protein
MSQSPSSPPVAWDAEQVTKLVQQLRRLSELNRPDDDLLSTELEVVAVPELTWGELAELSAVLSNAADALDAARHTITQQAQDSRATTQYARQIRELERQRDLYRSYMMDAVDALSPLQTGGDLCEAAGLRLGDSLIQDGIPWLILRVRQQAQEIARLREQLEWEVALKRALLPYQERAVRAEASRDDLLAQVLAIVDAHVSLGQREPLRDQIAALRAAQEPA